MSRHRFYLKILVILIGVTILALIGLLSSNRVSETLDTKNHIEVEQISQTESGQFQQKLPIRKLKSYETTDEALNSLHKISNSRTTLFRGDIPIHPSDTLSQVRHYGAFNHISPIKIPYKVVHIDLKGAPPKVSYLKYFLEVVAEAGANSILLEYEDTFPWDGKLNVSRANFHYTKDDIKEILSTAKSLSLEIIPLVQTFGHLEYVLKLKEFRHLRELDSYPQEICPKKNEAIELVKEIIDQVISQHTDPPLNYLHIGCDEVYHLGLCNKCKSFESKDLFLGHVYELASYVRSKGIIPIIWDDMLRKYYTEDLAKSGIGPLLEVMIWDYTEDVDRLLSPYIWPMYTQIFSNLWVAGAYKGAFGESLFKVQTHRHALNIMSWLSVLGRELPKIKNLRGLVLTGWSRYDHFSVQCELLPAAVPSAILGLEILKYQDLNNATNQMLKQLKCDSGNGKIIPEETLENLAHCIWEGNDFARELNTLQFYQDQINALITTHTKTKGWLTHYNYVHNYTSPWRIEEAISNAQNFLNGLQNFEATIKITLRKYYTEPIVLEWIDQRLGGLRHELNTMISHGQSLSRRRVWDKNRI